MPAEPGTFADRGEEQPQPAPARVLLDLVRQVVAQALQGVAETAADRDVSGQQPDRLGHRVGEPVSCGARPLAERACGEPTGKHGAGDCRQRIQRAQANQRSRKHQRGDDDERPHRPGRQPLRTAGHRHRRQRAAGTRTWRPPRWRRCPEEQDPGRRQHPCQQRKTPHGSPGASLPSLARSSATPSPVALAGWKDTAGTTCTRPPAVPSKNTETAEQAVPVRPPAEVDDDVQAGGGLGVQCVSPQAARQGKRLEPGRYVLQRVRVHGAAAALVPRVESGQQIDHLAPRTSPMTSRSGRIRSACRTRSRSTTAPAPSTLGGRASRQTTCGWLGRQLGCVLDHHEALTRVHEAEQGGQQGRLAGARAARHQEGEPGGHDGAQPLRHRPVSPSPAATSASRVHGRRAATRSDTVVPVRATGGRTACNRMPPGRGASHQGTASSSRRPASVASRWASRRTAASSRKRTGTRSRPAPRSTQTASGPLTRTSVTSGSRR